MFKKGSFFKSDLLWIVLLENSQKSENKVAFLVKKKLGRKAVLRNKVKRWLREIYRTNKKVFPENCNIVLLPAKPYKGLNFQKLYEDFLKIVSSQKFTDFNC